MTVTNRKMKVACIVTVVLAAMAAAGLVRAVWRRRSPPADESFVPVDSNDDYGEHPAGKRSRRATGVAGVLERAAAAGYSAVFDAEPEAALRCGACDAVSPANSFERRWQNRLEGASDPDDMAQVSGLVCPACGTRGTFVSLFGPSAGTDAAEVMVALPRPLGDLPAVAR